jgi:uncharacterized RDD family membrane protein YckC
VSAHQQPGSPAPPGYVPAPGGYGFVPEDYGWGSAPQPPPAANPAVPPTAAKPVAEPGAARAGTDGRPVLAPWSERALAGLIDFVGPYLLALAVYRAGSPRAGALLQLLAVFWGLFNGYQQGATGTSTGKRVVGLRTVRASDGQLLGGPAGFGRAFLHLVDVVTLGVGLLMPLWDVRRQTIADKIMGTVVVRTGGR